MDREERAEKRRRRQGTEAWGGGGDVTRLEGLDRERGVGEQPQPLQQAGPKIPS